MLRTLNLNEPKGSEVVGLPRRRSSASEHAELIVGQWGY